MLQMNRVVFENKRRKGKKGSTEDFYGKGQTREQLRARALVIGLIM